MDSNSTLAPNQHSSSWKGERSCVKEDHFAMATYNDNISESDHCIVYPAFPRPRLRIDSRIAALPEHEKEQRPVSSSLQEWDLFHDSLVVSGAKFTTAKSLGGRWIGYPAVAPLTRTGCHPAV